jgi:hypothetical protein
VKYSLVRGQIIGHNFVYLSLSHLTLLAFTARQQQQKVTATATPHRESRKGSNQVAIKECKERTMLKKLPGQRFHLVNKVSD